MKTIQYYYSPYVPCMVLLLIGLTGFSLFMMATLLPEAEGWSRYLLGGFLAFMGLFIVLSLKHVIRQMIRFARKQPALTLSPERLIDHQNGVEIPWEDISGIYRMNTGSSSFVKIYLHDSIPYIQRLSFVKRVLFAISRSLGAGETFRISLSWLKGNNDEIFATLEEFPHTKNH